MNKERVRKFLEEHSERYVSGEELGTALGISRTAIWKCVHSLQNEGYVISAVKNKGYCLQSAPDTLSVTEIRQSLETKYPVFVYREVESTNTTLRDMAEKGAGEGTIVVAETQSGGKGRLGRSFYSPTSGLYLSLLLRPKALSPTVKITVMAAVAACEAIEEVCKIKTRIKWVNDLYYSQRKVCGILTEASMGLETGSIDYVILGIGINITIPTGDFPPELSSIAGALLSQPKSNCKNKLSASFVNHFMRYYLHPSLNFIDAYKRLNFVKNIEVDVVRNGNVRRATAIDIDEQCRLIVRYDSGEIEALSFGEVSIRPTKEACYDKK